MVVPVLMTSCQVSENPKIGPLAAHTTTISTQMTKVHGRPARCATQLATLLKVLSIMQVLRETVDLRASAEKQAAAASGSKGVNFGATRGRNQTHARSAGA
ncbi:hypothetical protein ACVOMV_10865 [Mesorhizobium atlanticum]